MEEQNAIEVRNLTKVFKTYRDKSKTLREYLVRRQSQATITEVLSNINLDIHKGETVALIGTNGSGKSTLLKLMTKILYPTKGSVQTNGKVTSLLELGAGFHPDFTGRENIYFNAAIFGLSRSEIDARIDDIIEFSELGDFIDEPVRTYSSGMYMRLAFSVAINVDADILLIDEILAVGDQHFQNKCFDKLEELRDSDKTIVIVSHALSVMKVLCSRAVWIYKGTLRLDGDPAYVISQYLKQSALDNQEEAQKDDKERETRPTGIIFVDKPENYYTGPGKDLIIRGWSVDNCKDAEVQITFDDTIIPIPARQPRPDVFDVYEEDYAGMLDPDTIGFEVPVPRELLTEGNHRIEALLSHHGKQLDRKRLSIKITEAA